MEYISTSNNLSKEIEEINGDLAEIGWLASLGKKCKGKTVEEIELTQKEIQMAVDEIQSRIDEGIWGQNLTEDAMLVRIAQKYTRPKIRFFINEFGKLQRAS